MDLGSETHTYLTSIQYINDSLRIVIHALNVKTLILSPISLRTGKILNSISQEQEGIYKLSLDNSGVKHDSRSKKTSSRSRMSAAQVPGVIMISPLQHFV